MWPYKSAGRASVSNKSRDSISVTNYEEELVNKKVYIDRDSLKDLLLFPDDDLVVKQRQAESKTERSSVPPEVLTDAVSMFTSECAACFTSDWVFLDSTFEAYGGNYLQLPSVEKLMAANNLQPQVFDVDLAEVVDGTEDTLPAPSRVKGLHREGYLTMLPLVLDGIVQGKGTKRHWFILKELSSDGSYVLEHKKDDKSTTVKGTVYLETCTQLRKGIRGKLHGFELHVQDRMYSLAADSSQDLDGWVQVICQATGLDIDLERVGSSSYSGGKGGSTRAFSLKDNLKSSNSPVLLEYSKETDQGNLKKRRTNRSVIYTLYSGLFRGSFCIPANDKVPPVPHPTETTGSRFTLKCDRLHFRYKSGENWSEMNNGFEPFLVYFALFDLRDQRKISEDFCCDPNDPKLSSMLSPSLTSVMAAGKIVKGLHLDTVDIRIREAIFSVVNPNDDIYLVVRINKILQGSISTCVEPYLKGDLKAVQKAEKRLTQAVKSLGSYMMPFLWTARKLFSKGEFDSSSEFLPLMKQDCNRLSNSDILKALSEYKANDHKVKHQVVPGSLVCFLTAYQGAATNCLSSSYLPIKPFSPPNKETIAVEVLEMPSVSLKHVRPCASYYNHLYVHPVMVNFSSLKSAIKIRNIACTIELKADDVPGAAALPFLYCRSGQCGFVSQVTTPVLHHNPSPCFYDEVKILIPHVVHEKYHVLFTFYHISVSSGKDENTLKRKKDLDTVIGYSCLPLFVNKRLRCNDPDISLPVMTDLVRCYLSVDPERVGSPEAKWIDGIGKPLFRVGIYFLTSVLCQDQHLVSLFDLLPNTENVTELCRLIKLLHIADTAELFRFLHVILNYLMKLLVQQENDSVIKNVVRLMVHIVQKVSTEGNESDLKTYVKFLFGSNLPPGNTDTKASRIHEVLVRVLLYFVEMANDQVLADHILTYSTFFFEVITKSMVLYLHYTGLKKFARDKRFSNDYVETFKKFVQAFIKLYLSRGKQLNSGGALSNQSMAKFFKSCLSIMDRGMLLQLIGFAIKQISSSDAPNATQLKFDFLEIVCNHEHFIPLNLPLDFRGLGGGFEVTLSEKYSGQHYLLALLLHEFSSSLRKDRESRRCAIKVVRNLLVKHGMDDRYFGQEIKLSRVSTLYLPYLTILVENVARFDVRRQGSYSGSTQDTPGWSDQKMDMFSEDESRELLLCVLGIIQQMETAGLVEWWRQLVRLSPKVTSAYLAQATGLTGTPQMYSLLLDFLDLMISAVHAFGYKGKANILQQLAISMIGLADTKSSMSVDRHTWRMSKLPLTLEQRFLSESKSPRSTAATTPVLGNLGQTPSGSQTGGKVDDTDQLNACCANEVALVVLDSIELFCVHFKGQMEQDHGNNVLMHKVFDVLITLLNVEQSEHASKFVFATLRSFVHRFTQIFYRGSVNLCSTLCVEVLKKCGSKIESVRNEACYFLYILLRGNFEYTSTNCVRVHLQIMIALSSIVDKINTGVLRRSVRFLLDIMNEDKVMKNTDFPAEMRELTKKIYTVLRVSSQVKEHQDDHELLVDLLNSLAQSYSSTPELRQTWLDKIADLQTSQGNHSEAAMCYIHSAASMAEGLKKQGLYPEGSSVFRIISPNLSVDDGPSALADESVDELQFTLPRYIGYLVSAVDKLILAERYETVNDMYKIILPLLEKQKNYKEMAIAYSKLSDACQKVVDVLASGKRLLGRYYRVSFYGKAFREDHGKEFIYKEPKVTSLPEISSRLEALFSKKYGAVKIILESTKVKQQELLPGVCYVQVNFVEPYFSEGELASRATDFERNTNIRRFKLETPFTLGGKAHGALREQCKRVTILTTSHSFPYIKKRILVVQQEVHELSPIEVAINEMSCKVRELKEVYQLDQPDMKRLQLKLQGSVSVQVNAGPLAYASAFLDKEVRSTHNMKHVESLEAVYREFVQICGLVLDLNETLIQNDQRLYQEDLRAKYAELRCQLQTYISLEV